MGSKAVGGKAQYRSQKKEIFDLFLWQEGKKRKTVIDRRVMERQRRQEVNVNRLKVRKKTERRMTPRSERGEVGGLVGWGNHLAPRCHLCAFCSVSIPVQ